MTAWSISVAIIAPRVSPSDVHLSSSLPCLTLCSMAIHCIDGMSRTVAATKLQTDVFTANMSSLCRHQELRESAVRGIAGPGARHTFNLQGKDCLI